MDVRCELCPKSCLIAPGQSGECRVRVNLDGKLHAVTYGYPCSVHVDPVEKKPIFHFLPGTGTFSLATVGCNLHCKNCQNWEISQRNPEDMPGYTLSPADLVAGALRYDCRSVSFTYTDPVVFYEYTLDSCLRAHEVGLQNILVTAAYIQPGPWRELLAHVDGVRIDLKALSEAFYRDICSATLQPVLDSLLIARDAVRVLEVVHLIIPTLNDSDDALGALCKWIRENLGADSPLHFSRFFPHYRMRNLPPTPLATLYRAREIAAAEGLHYVYLGNVTEPDSANTHCPGCRALLVARRGYTVLQNRISNGRCPDCKTEIYGLWNL